MRIHKGKVIAALGGSQAVHGMDSEAKAEALEAYLSKELDNAAFARLGAPLKPMTAHELDEQIDKRPLRRGIGTLLASGGTNPFGTRLPNEPMNVPRLPPMPAKPTLLDFFKLRFAPATHVLQSADKALAAGLPEDIVLACLLHDLGQALMKADHGWWAAQLFDPYVSKKVRSRSATIRHCDFIRILRSAMNIRSCTISSSEPTTCRRPTLKPRINIAAPTGGTWRRG